MLTSVKITESPSNTYIIPIYKEGFDKLGFVQFVLPQEYKEHGATWYFYNKLDFSSCGGSAYPIEYHTDIKIIN